MFYNFSILLSSYLDFCEKCLKKKKLKKNSKKIMKSAMGILYVDDDPLCGHSTSTPDKQLNRQVFFFMNFVMNDEVPRRWSCNLIV